MVNVTVIICTWNGKHMMGPCLDSLKKQTYKDFEVIVVDNGSIDGTMEFLKKRYPWVRIVRNEKNLGFAGGMNSAVPHAKGKYLALINNDAQADKDWLSQIVSVIESDPTVFGVGTSAREKYGKDHFETFRYGTTCFFGQIAVDTRIPKVYKGLIEYWGPSGGSCILRNLHEPLYPDDYFMYGEDQWLIWKMRLMGYDSFLNPKANITHEGEASSNKIPFKKIFYQERNRLINALIAYQAWTLIRLTPLLLANVLSSLIYDIRRAHIRLLAHLWILTHPINIWRKRQYLQNLRKVPDSEIVKYLSCKYYEEDLVHNNVFRAIVKSLNALQCGYCRLVGLKTTENYRRVKGRLVT